VGSACACLTGRLGIKKSSGTYGFETNMGDDLSFLSADEQSWDPFPGCFYFGGGTSEDFPGRGTGKAWCPNPSPPRCPTDKRPPRLPGAGPTRTSHLVRHTWVPDQPPARYDG
jgi:hypothetical protein